MQSSRVYNQAAFLLRRRPFTESSVLIDLFSRTYGRVVLIAKGARKVKSRWRGSLLPFQPLVAAWSGRGDVKTVTAIETETPAHPLEGKALYCGYYLNELILRMLPRFDPYEGLFDNYDEVLAKMARDTDLEWNLRIFEKQLLQYLGYGMHLENDVDHGKRIDPDCRYCYLPGTGPVQLDNSGDGVWIHGSTLLALDTGKVRAHRERKEAKVLLRTLVDYHLGGQLLRTRAVYARLFSSNSAVNSVAAD